MSSFFCSCLLIELIEAPLLKDWLQKVSESGNSDALLLALKLHEKILSEMRNICKMLSHACNLSDLFTPDHMLLFSSCIEGNILFSSLSSSYLESSGRHFVAYLVVVTKNATLSHLLDRCEVLDKSYQNCFKIFETPRISIIVGVISLICGGIMESVFKFSWF
jgi:hypothetical protein